MTPPKDSYSRLVLNVFLQTSSLLSSQMVGALHVPRHELAAEMSARGFEMTDYFVEKFAVCEQAYRRTYAAREAELKDAEGA